MVFKKLKIIYWSRLLLKEIKMNKFFLRLSVIVIVLVVGLLVIGKITDRGFSEDYLIRKAESHIASMEKLGELDWSANGSSWYVRILCSGEDVIEINNSKLLPSGNFTGCSYYIARDLEIVPKTKFLSQQTWLAFKPILGGGGD